jgi:uncharacterized protein YggU (UPF0235/DUF167 family)
MAKPRAAKSPGEESFVIAVRAKPRSSVSSLDADDSGNWTARLRSSPVDSKANTELVGLIARHFGCPKSSVAIVSGATARLKLVRVSGPIAPAHLVKR